MFHLGDYMMTGLKSLAVAQYIIDNIKSTKNPIITPMKLIKLIYISHGYMLGRYGYSLLDEHIKAYKTGVSIESVYNAVRDFRDYPVSNIIGANKWKGQFNQQEKDTMNYVISTYNVYDVATIGLAIIANDTPWTITREITQDDANIPDGLIQLFYKNLLTEKSHSKL